MIHFHVHALDRVCALQLGARQAGEGARLLGHELPCFYGMVVVWLIECQADRGGEDCELTLRDVRQGIAHPVNVAALPGCLEDAQDGAILDR